jgi:hypothetical protein
MAEPELEDRLQPLGDLRRRPTKKFQSGSNSSPFAASRAL